MNAIQLLSSQAWVVHLGRTLVHFLWQGVFIAVLYAAARWMFRSSSPNTRYFLGCGALAAMMAVPFVTLILMRTPASVPVSTYLAGSIPMAASSVTAMTVAVPVTVSGGWSAYLLPGVVAIWLVGAIAFWIRLMGSWAVAAGLRSTQGRPASPEWQHTLRTLGARLGLCRPVQLLVSAVVQVPTVVGWIRPIVLMPIGALTGLPSEQVEALLIHELAHIRRHDYLVNILQGIVETLLFYHPAVWWVSGHIRSEREMCCDDIAVSVSGDVLTYASALAELESLRPAHLPAAANVAIGADGGSLANRIGRLLGQSRPAAQTASGPGTLLSAILIGATACVVFVMLSSTFTAEAQTTASLQARGNLNQGIHAFADARYEAATAYFQQALTLDPGLTEAELNLANVYSAQFIPGSQTVENQAFAGKAVQGFQDVLRKEPNNFTAIAGLATIYQSTNEFRKAREFYLKAEQVEPLKPAPFYGVGALDWYIVFNKKAATSPEEKAQLIEEGLHHLDIALTISPDYADAMTFTNLLLREKAMLASDAGEKTRLVAEADQWFTKALETRRKNPSVAVPWVASVLAPPPPPRPVPR